MVEAKQVGFTPIKPGLEILAGMRSNVRRPRVASGDSRILWRGNVTLREFRLWNSGGCIFRVLRVTILPIVFS
jgi:hypothetical protein